MSKIEKAVREWIRAEFLFRHGPFCFEREAADAYFMAESRLRALVSGAADLRGAAINSGVDVHSLEEKRAARLGSFSQAPRKAPRRSDRVRMTDDPPRPPKAQEKRSSGVSGAPRKRARLDEPAPSPAPKKGKKRKGKPGGSWGRGFFS